MILRTENLRKKYGNLTAVNQVSWGVEEGQTKAVIGPNGAGKTTLFNMLAGIIEPTDGNITLNDEEITEYPSHERVKKGLVKTFQRTNVFEELSVFENIRIAVQAQITTFDIVSRADNLTDVNERAEEIVVQIGLVAEAAEPVEELSYGNQRKVEVGIALATDPLVVLLDEPTAGMSREETDNMLELLNDVGAGGNLTTVITEHDIEVILELADKITVLNQGKVVAEGDPDEIIASEEVQRIYLGETNVA